MIPARPCASVSCSSRAIRWRSSTTPSSRACATSCSLQRLVLAQRRLELLHELRAPLVALLADVGEEHDRAGHPDVHDDDERVDDDRADAAVRQAAVLRRGRDDRDRGHAHRPHALGQQHDAEVAGEREEPVPGGDDHERRHERDQAREVHAMSRGRRASRGAARPPQHPRRRPDGEGGQDPERSVRVGLADRGSRRRGRSPAGRRATCRGRPPPVAPTARTAVPSCSRHSQRKSLVASSEPATA